MAAIVDYAQVLARMQGMGLECVYYNGGSFGFPRGEAVQIVGWLSGPDPTIRLGLGRLVEVPLPIDNLGRMLSEIWLQRLSGPAWILPKAHWSFELDHGNGGWMRQLLDGVVDADALAPLTNAAAIKFEPGESAFFSTVMGLFDHLKTSDFAVLFPDHRHLVTLHHHKQIWWQTADLAFANALAGWWGGR